MAEETASEVQSPALQTEHCDDVGPYWNARQFSVTTSRKSTEYEEDDANRDTSAYDGACMHDTSFPHSPPAWSFAT